jgi:hypothetical protein
MMKQSYLKPLISSTPHALRYSGFTAVDRSERAFIDDGIIRTLLYDTLPKERNIDIDVANQSDYKPAEVARAIPTKPQDLIGLKKLGREKSFVEPTRQQDVWDHKGLVRQMDKAALDVALAEIRRPEDIGITKYRRFPNLFIVWLNLIHGHTATRRLPVRSC